MDITLRLDRDRDRQSARFVTAPHHDDAALLAVLHPALELNQRAEQGCDHLERGVRAWSSGVRSPGVLGPPRARTSCSCPSPGTDFYCSYVTMRAAGASSATRCFRPAGLAASPARGLDRRCPSPPATSRIPCASVRAAGPCHAPRGAPVERNPQDASAGLVLARNRRRRRCDSSARITPPARRGRSGSGCRRKRARGRSLHGGTTAVVRSPREGAAAPAERSGAG